MRRFFILVFLLLFATLEAKPLLLDNLSSAVPGEYVVVRRGQEYILVHIHSKENNKLTIEEVTVPSKNVKKPFEWKSWFEKGAANNSSWSMFEVFLDSGKIGEFYSFSSRRWLDISGLGNIFTKLLNLEFTIVPASKRRRRGGSSEVSKRPLWSPPVVFNSMKMKNVHFDVWRSSWPKDGTELAGKSIDIYLPQKKENLPSYWPFWLEVRAGPGRANMRIVDGGSNLKSPKPFLVHFEK